ncbi:hypothetical protein BLOT_010492 [Blomia tropicalis]|nr:hypothetical protein BLOT_010492 [Blomia tropicalis]
MFVYFKSCINANYQSTLIHNNLQISNVKIESNHLSYTFEKVNKISFPFLLNTGQNSRWKAPYNTHI